MSDQLQADSVLMGWGSELSGICRRVSEYVLTPKNVTFFHSKLLLHYCKFHNIKHEQLDIIASQILLMLTMLPSLCLICSKQTASSNQCLCCSTGLKVILPKTKLQTVGVYPGGWGSILTP